jgi:PAS domain S-box-containing protein
MIDNHPSGLQDLAREVTGLRQEIADLRQRLEEAEETLNAIRNGEVDALVVNTKDGEKTFTLEGADTFYRTAIENIKEGAITLSAEGTILYANHYFGQIIERKLNQIMGTALSDYVGPESGIIIQSLLSQQNAQAEINFYAGDGTIVPCYITTTMLDFELPVVCAVITDLTQQKRDDEIIAEARLLQGIMAQSAEGLIVCDAKGIILHTSMEAQKMVGHFVVGKRFKDEFNILRADNIPVTLHSLNAGEIPPQTEVTMKQAGQEKIYLMSYSKLAVGELILGHVIILTDITTIKKSEETLAKSEERFRSVLENSRDVIYRFDLKTGRYEYISPSAETIAGYTADELIAQDTKASLDMVHPEDVTVLTNAIKLLGETGYATADYRQRTKNGEYRWLSNRMALVKNSFGQPLYRIGNIRDITENKQMENALCESEAKFRLLVSSVKDYAIFMIDPSGNVMSWNEGAKNIKGYDAEEIIGKHFSRFYTLENVKAGKPNHDLEKALAEGRFEEEAPRVRKDGSTFLADVIITPIKDTNGHLAGYSKVVRDITASKMAEEELKRQEEQLQAVNQELEAFSYSVSHDLRAPLRSLSGFSGILLEDYGTKLDEEGKVYLHKIQESSEYLSKLIDDLLKLARVAQNEISIEDLDLSEMAQKIIDELQNGDPRRRAEVCIEPGLCGRGDRVLIGQVLENLLNNAWKYNSKKPETKIEMGSVVHEGQTAYYVRDHGAGFDMTYADKLFKPFQRLHAASEFEGTGIGLAIVQRIIRRHGGKVWAKGKAGEGATFYFTLN